MPFTLYNDKKEVIADNLSNKFTISNLEPLHIYKGWSVSNGEKTLPLKDMKTTSSPAQTININPTAITLNIGGTSQITPLVYPTDTTDTVSYNTSDAEIAIVNDTGLVTAVGEGSTVINVVAGGQTASLVVTVSPKDDEQ